MSSTAPAPDKSLEDLEKHILPLSEYYKTLDVIVKRRYLQKISVVGLDPATLVDGKLNSDCLPPIEALDLLSYLVLDTSYYTNDQFKNFKSLEAYNQLVSGFVTFYLSGLSPQTTARFCQPIAWDAKQGLEKPALMLQAHCIMLNAGQKCIVNSLALKLNASG